MRSTTVSEDSIPTNKTGSKPASERLWARAVRWFVQGRARRVRREQFLALPPSHVFAFIVDGANLEPTTPSSLRFHLLTPLPVTIEAGQTLEYQWRFLFRRLQMKVKIAQVSSPTLIEEIQESGPFRVWHYFRKLKITTGGTWIVDELEYHLPRGIFGTLLDRLFVRRKLEHLFDYRQARLIELLLSDAAHAAQSPATGAIRTRLRRPSRSADSQ